LFRRRGGGRRKNYHIFARTIYLLTGQEAKAQMEINEYSRSGFHTYWHRHFSSAKLGQIELNNRNIYGGFKY
jgi:hypothetical protein